MTKMETVMSDLGQPARLLQDHELDAVMGGVIGGCIRLPASSCSPSRRSPRLRGSATCGSRSAAPATSRPEPNIEPPPTRERTHVMQTTLDTASSDQLRELSAEELDAIDGGGIHLHGTIFGIHFGLDITESGIAGHIRFGDGPLHDGVIWF
jgi:hypothetical protein